MVRIKGYEKMVDTPSDAPDGSRDFNDKPANEPDGTQNTSNASGAGPDGYYDEDMGSDDEIDLSFLDEKEPGAKK